MSELLLDGGIELREGAERPWAVPDVLEHNGAVSAGPALPEAVPGCPGAGGRTCTAALISRSNLTISWWHTRSGTAAAAAAILAGQGRAGRARAPPAGGGRGRAGLRGRGGAGAHGGE